MPTRHSGTLLRSPHAALAGHVARMHSALESLGADRGGSMRTPTLTPSTHHLLMLERHGPGAPGHPQTGAGREVPSP